MPTGLRGRSGRGRRRPALRLITDARFETSLARARRESYVGPRLPEPLPTGTAPGIEQVLLVRTPDKPGGLGDGTPSPT